MSTAEVPGASGPTSVLWTDMISWSTCSRAAGGGTAAPMGKVRGPVGVRHGLGLERALQETHLRPQRCPGKLTRLPFLLACSTHLPLLSQEVQEVEVPEKERCLEMDRDGAQDSERRAPPFLGLCPDAFRRTSTPQGLLGLDTHLVLHLPLSLISSHPFILCWPPSWLTLDPRPSEPSPII